MSYFKDGWAGSHDLRFGYDWKHDRRNFFQDQPFDIFYRDTGTCGEPGRPLQYAELARERGGVSRGLDRRQLEGEQPPDAEPGRAARVLQGRLAGAGVHSQRAPVNWRTGTTRGIARWSRPSRSKRARSRRRRHSRRVSVSPTTCSATTAPCSRFSGASSGSTRPTRSPTRRTRSAGNGFATSWTDLNGNRLLDGPAEIVRLRAVRRCRRGSRDRRSQHQAACFERSLDQRRTRNPPGSVGARLVCV